MNFQIISNPYPHDDRSKEVLKNCADHVQKRGLNYLIPKWKGYAKLYEDGYDIEDYFCEFLNDMDARHLIDRVLKVLNQREREMIAEEIEPYDKLFIEWTVELKTCVWGEKNEKDKGYNRKDNWYYYRAPENLIAIEPEKFLNK